MPVDGTREKLNLDFGIEDTVDAGDKEVLNLFLGGSATGNPDDIQDKDATTSSSTTTEKTTKPVQKQATTTKKEDKVPLEEEGEKNQVDVAETILNGETQEGDTSTKDENEGGKSIMTSLAEEFVGLGIFEAPGEDQEFDPNMKPEDFLKLYKENNNRVINDTLEGFLGRFGEDYREAFDAIFVKGVDPKEYLQTFVKLQDVAGLDMTIEANQVKVYKEYLTRQGFPEDKIEARVIKAKANGDLEEDSIDYQKILVDQDAKELATKKEETEKKVLAERRGKQLFAQNANKILVEKAKEKEFDGIPLTDQIAKSTFDFLTQEKYTLPTGESLTEFDKFILELRRPENAALKVKIGLLAQSNFDLSKIKIKEKNAATSEAFQWAIKNKQTTSNKNGAKDQLKIKETEPFI